MINCLYEPFRKWSERGAVYIISDPHFGDQDCKYMDEGWISPEEQVDIINKMVFKHDTLIILGDVGDKEYVKKIRCRNRVLILGNHDGKHTYDDVFGEVYNGALFISDKILLSHEPIDLKFCLNIHGHDHSNKFVRKYHGINVAANVCGYTPINLGNLIKEGALSDIKTIHRYAIDRQINRSKHGDVDDSCIKSAYKEFKHYVCMVSENLVSHSKGHMSDNAFVDKVRRLTADAYEKVRDLRGGSH